MARGRPKALLSMSEDERSQLLPPRRKEHASRVKYQRLSVWSDPRSVD